MSNETPRPDDAQPKEQSPAQQLPDLEASTPEPVDAESVRGGFEGAEKAPLSSFKNLGVF